MDISMCNWIWLLGLTDYKVCFNSRSPIQYGCCCPKLFFSLCLTFVNNVVRQGYYRKMLSIKESLGIQTKTSSQVSKFSQKRKSACSMAAHPKMTSAGLPTCSEPDWLLQFPSPLPTPWFVLRRCISKQVVHWSSDTFFKSHLSP